MSVAGLSLKKSFLIALIIFETRCSSPDNIISISASYISGKLNVLS